MNSTNHLKNPISIASGIATTYLPYWISWTFNCFFFNAFISTFITYRMQLTELLDTPRSKWYDFKTAIRVIQKHDFFVVLYPSNFAPTMGSTFVSVLLMLLYTTQVKFPFLNSGRKSCACTENWNPGSEIIDPNQILPLFWNFFLDTKYLFFQY